MPHLVQNTSSLDPLVLPTVPSCPLLWLSDILTVPSLHHGMKATLCLTEHHLGHTQGGSNLVAIF